MYVLDNIVVTLAVDFDQQKNSDCRFILASKRSDWSRHLVLWEIGRGV